MRELTNLHDVFEKLEKLVGTKDSKEDLMDVSTLHNAAGVGTVPFAFGLRDKKSNACAIDQNTIIILESLRAKLAKADTTKGFRKGYQR